MKTLYQEFAQLVQARINCLASGNDEWEAKHQDRIEQLCREYMPRGSGVDSGTTIDLDKSDGNKLVFNTSYHHMNDNGCYDGWTEHQVIVTPDLASGCRMKITGRDRNEIKEYLHDLFHSALESTDIKQPVQAVAS